MESLTTFLALTAGLFLRLVLPIAITAVAVYALRRLDSRWQAEAESYIEIPSPLGERPECWMLRKCPPEKMQACPVPSSPMPCWQVLKRQGGDLQEACLTCEVFLAAPLLRAHAHA